MHMRSRLAMIAAWVVAATILVIGGCEKAPPDQQKNLQPVSTRLKWLPGATYIGSIVAKEAGIWRELGLDVTVHPGGFEADPIKLVAAGSNDFGITGGEQLLQARAQGVPIVAIFMELRQSPAGWMALKSSGITKPQDFVGKKVGAQYGTNIEPTLDALLAKLSIDPKRLIRVPVKYDVSPLFTGQVNVLPAYLNGQPVQARLEGKEINTIDPADYGVRMYGNVYFTSEKMIRERPELVARFVRGLVRAWNKALAEPEAAVDMLVRAEPKLDRKLELAILQATVPFARGGSSEALGVMSDERWQETRDIMVKYAGLPAAVDVSSAYTSKFVLEAYASEKR